MKKKLSVVLLLFILIANCKKNDSSAPNAPGTPEVKINFTLDKTTSEPGLLGILVADRAITKDTCTVSIGVNSILLSKIDSFHYAFIVPVLTPGVYKIELDKINAANSPSITISNYNPIPDINESISKAEDAFKKSVDSLIAKSFNNSISANNADFMHQLINQVHKTIQGLSGDQKLLAAYQLQHAGFDTLAFEPFNIDTSHLDRLSGTDDEIAFQLLDNATEAKLANNAASFAAASGIAMAVAWYATGGTAVNLGVGSLVSFGIAAYFKGKAKTLSEQASYMTAVATDNPAIMDGTGSDNNPIDFKPNNNILKRLISKFRTIQQSDKATFNSPGITDFIVSCENLQAQDGVLKQWYDKLKNLVANFFDQVSASYELYISPVLVQSREKAAELQYPFVSLGNISNSDIKLSVSPDGTNGLSITATNPSNNLSAPTNFTFELMYKQDAINNKKTATIAAKYTPLGVPVLTTISVSSATATSAICGGNITNDGGTDITARGVCWSTTNNPTISNVKTNDGAGAGNFTSNITGLTANTTYYVKAYATNSIGTAYGNEEVFTTKKPDSCAPSMLNGFTLLGDFNGHRYFISNSIATWHQAYSSIVVPRAHLVTITSADENNFISSSTSLSAWIGLTDEGSEGSFYWITGEPQQFTSWLNGEPNNAGGNENWVHINWGEIGKWNDAIETYQTYYIIEFDCID